MIDQSTQHTRLTEKSGESKSVSIGTSPGTTVLIFNENGERIYGLIVNETSAERESGAQGPVVRAAGRRSRLSAWVNNGYSVEIAKGETSSFEHKSTKDSSRPRQTIPIWLTPEEASQIIAISEKQSLLGSVASKVWAAKATQATQ